MRDFPPELLAAVFTRCDLLTVACVCRHWREIVRTLDARVADQAAYALGLADELVPMPFEDVKDIAHVNVLNYIKLQFPGRRMHAWMWQRGRLAGIEGGNARNSIGVYCKHGHINQLKETCIRFGFGQKDISKSILELACGGGHISVLQYLVEELGVFTLGRAASNLASLPMLEYAIKHNLGPIPYSELLQKVCSRGDLEMAKFIIGTGQVSADDVRNWIPRNKKPVWLKHTPLVRLLVDEFSLGVSYLCTHLSDLSAVACESLPMMQYLIEQLGADTVLEIPLSVNIDISVFKYLMSTGLIGKPFDWELFEPGFIGHVCGRDDWSLMRCLVEELNADIPAAIEDTDWGLVNFMQGGTLSQIKYLFEHTGLTPDYIRAKGIVSELMDNAIAGALDDVVIYMVHTLIIPDGRDIREFVPLMCGCSSLSTISQLTQDVDLLPCMEDALREACTHDLDVVKYLISKGGTLEHIRAGDNEALQNAFGSEHLDIAKYLFEEMGLTLADARSNDNDILVSACCGGDLEMLRYLVEVVGMTKWDAINSQLPEVLDDLTYEVSHYLKTTFGM